MFDPDSRTDVISGDSDELLPSTSAQQLLQLYRAYEPFLDENLWPWETERWHELVSCILTVVAEPEFGPDSIQEITRMLAWANLLDIDELAEIAALSQEIRESHNTFVAVSTVLRKSGLTSAEAEKAATAICDAALGFAKHYDGKAQKYLRYCATLMLQEMSKSFSFSQLDAPTAVRGFSLWFQNALNLPIPTPDPIVHRVCASLGVDYDELVTVADGIDVNVALLDNVLRAYWQRDIELSDEEDGS